MSRKALWIRGLVGAVAVAVTTTSALAVDYTCNCAGFSKCLGAASVQCKATESCCCCQASATAPWTCGCRTFDCNNPGGTWTCTFT